MKRALYSGEMEEEGRQSIRRNKPPQKQSWIFELISTPKKEDVEEASPVKTVKVIDELVS